ncbi:MAG: HEAT repeat domain-containing protein [Bryobacteraceae bacterium]
MQTRFSNTPIHWLASLLLLAGSFIAPLSAAQENELKDESGKTIVKYVVEVPPGIAPAGATDPARQVGLILCFQEHDTPTGNDLFPVRQALWRRGLVDKYIRLAAAPQSRKFGPADHQPLEKLIAWAMKTYPINPRRVYMYGKGEGSKISMEFMMTHPNVITAAIGYSWGAWLMPSELKEPLDFVNRAPEIYLTLGRRDLDNHISCVRDAYLRLKAKGYHLIYREFDELGDRTYHPASNDDALLWATRLRNKNIAPSAEETKLLKAFNVTPPASVDGYYPTLALVGGAPAGAVLQKLFESKDAKVRAAAAATCSHGIFGQAAIEALTKLASDPSVKVRQETVRALAMYANWRYEAAQKSLIALATGKNADPLDRLNATDAIGYALRLQVKGVRQDPEMFKALVSLLQEKEEPVRSTAAGILAPIYEPAVAVSGSPRRRSPEGGWEKWLGEITAKEKGAPQAVNQDPAAAFELTLKAAEMGQTPAQAAVAMMYANGKGVQQNYAEAGKWWIKAAEGGDLIAARHAWNLYRNGEGAERNPAIANRWAAVLGEPVRPPRNSQPTSSVTNPR